MDKKTIFTADSPQQDLLLEIGCEELPTHAVSPLAHNLADALIGRLKVAGLVEGKIESQTFATPRRIAVYVKNVAYQLAPQIIERQGPAYEQAFDSQGNPTPAATGFAKSCGVDVTQLSQKNNRLYFRVEKSGAKTLEVLSELAKDAIHHIRIAKPMRWGTHPDSFARPVHWILFLFGSAVVKTQLFGIDAGKQTLGHRFHHPQPCPVDEPKNYAAVLKNQGQVIADFSERQQIIRQAIIDATPPRYTVEIDEELLHEVTSLVEWPAALVGHFNPEFLTVPQEVLITSMKINQKYFPVLNQQGQLQPAFILISNIDSKDPAIIVHGNERVLNARLADAAFFFKNDCEHSLQSRLPRLEHITFQKQLGSLADKTARLVTLSALLASALGENISVTKQAAQLSKCDLTSEMVCEFPTLQGVMGYYYAKNDGLSEACALAIKEHYYPRYSGDTLPGATAGCIVALADRLDTLIGIFGIGQAPSGDKDPFALRRAALGVLRILIEKSLPLDLLQWLEAAKQAYSFHLPNTEVVNQTFDFVMSRLKSWYLEKGTSAEVFEAVLACRPTQPLDFDRRIYAVQQFQTLPAASALAAANKRVSNILKKQAQEFPSVKINAQLFEHEAERRLAEQLAIQTKIVTQLYTEGNYTAALKALSSLKEPVDIFFDKVMVMVDDPAKRNNRLVLLSSLHHLFTQVADISLL